MAVKKHKQKKVIYRKNVGKNNLARKYDIDKIFNDFELEINKIKQNRDVVVSDFINSLKEKYIEYLKKNINY